MSEDKEPGLYYRHGENPDWKKVGWRLFWLIWCAAWAGYGIGSQHWVTVGIQVLCLIAWIWLIQDALRHLTWHVYEIRVVPPKGDLLAHATEEEQ